MLAFIPHVGLYDVNFSFAETEIRSKSLADSSIEEIDTALDSLISARSQVAAGLTVAESAVDNVNQSIDVKTRGQAELVASNVASDVRELTNLLMQLGVSTEVVNRSLEMQRTHSTRVSDLIRTA